MSVLSNKYMCGNTLLPNPSTQTGWLCVKITLWARNSCLVKGKTAIGREVRYMIVISSRETGLISLVIKTHQAQHVVQPLAGDAKWDWRKMFQGPSVELFKVRCDLFNHRIKVKESNVKNSNHKKNEKRKKNINLGGNLSTYESKTQPQTTHRANTPPKLPYTTVPNL